MTRYFASYVITGGGSIPPLYGWVEVSSDGPIVGEAELAGLQRKMISLLVRRRLAAPGDLVSLLNWRRFESPE